jgi:hypothetical protein
MNYRRHWHPQINGRYTAQNTTKNMMEQKVANGRGLPFSFFTSQQQPMGIHSVVLPPSFPYPSLLVAAHFLPIHKVAHGERGREWKVWAMGVWGMIVGIVQVARRYNSSHQTKAFTQFA